MTRAGRISGRLQGMGLLLATLALAVRLAFPTGFMLSPEATALPTLVICTGSGAMTVAIDDQGVAHEVKADPGGDHKSDGKTSHPCTFAVATIAALSPNLIAVPLVLVPATLAAPALNPTQRPGLGLAAPPPPKTGPPSSL